MIQKLRWAWKSYDHVMDSICQFIHGMSNGRCCCFYFFYLQNKNFLLKKIVPWETMTIFFSIFNAFYTKQSFYTLECLLYGNIDFIFSSLKRIHFSCWSISDFLLLKLYDSTVSCPLSLPVLLYEPHIHNIHFNYLIDVRFLCHGGMQETVHHL